MIRKLPKLHDLFAVGVLMSLPVSAATPRPLAEAAASLSRRLPKGVVVTGESIHGEVIYACTGTLEPAGVPPERVLFEIGSITKVFTGILLAQAVLEDKVALDTTLQEVLGKEQTYADSRVGAITLRELATHTSGLPRIPDDLTAGGDMRDPYARYDRLRLNAFLARVKLTGERPFDSSYSNLGVGLLGDILSRLYNKPWEKLVAEKITGPLGMKDTVVTPDETQQKRVAPPYEGARQMSPWHLAALAGCGALRSTAEDMILFGEAILHPDKSPLKEALSLVMRPQTKDGDIGLALMISKFDGQCEYEHGGGTGGFRSVLQVLPDSGTIRVALINNAALDSSAVLAAVRNEKPRAHESDKVLTEEQLAEYEGVYPLGPQARFTIVRRGDHLWTQLTGQAFLKLFPHETEDRFFLKVVAAELQFHRENGKIVSLTNHQNGRELTVKKSTQPAPRFIFRKQAELASFTGTYELAPGMIFSLTTGGSTLFAKLTGQPPAPVFEKRDDWFEYDVVDAALEFERDKDGAIIALKLHQNGIVQRAVKRR